MAERGPSPRPGGRRSNPVSPGGPDPTGAEERTADVQARTGRHEADLWRRSGDAGDRRAREELIALHMPIARRIARRYAGIAEPYDDLLQVASLGLLNAVDRFDPALGIPFGGFARPTIHGEIKRHFRDRVWTVRVPRSLHDRMARVEKAEGRLRLDLHRPPSVGELAADLAIDPQEVLEALEARSNRSPLSLDAPPAGEEIDAFSSRDLVGEEDLGYGLIEDRLTVEAALPALDGRERSILKMRFIDDLPQTRIAERVGCSQMQVSRVLRRALERLRRQAEGEPDGPGPVGQGGSVDSTTGYSARS